MAPNCMFVCMFRYLHCLLISEFSRYNDNHNQTVSSYLMGELAEKFDQKEIKSMLLIMQVSSNRNYVNYRKLGNISDLYIVVSDIYMCLSL